MQTRDEGSRDAIDLSKEELFDFSIDVSVSEGSMYPLRTNVISELNSSKK